MPKKFNYIKDDVIIDFEIPKLLKNTIQEAEELDRAHSLEYFCVADAIDVLCKNYVSNNNLTQEQWNIITWKYSVNGKDG